MKKKFFKFATLPCAVAVALVGGSVLFSCSGDDETGVEELQVLIGANICHLVTYSIFHSNNSIKVRNSVEYN